MTYFHLIHRLNIGMSIMFCVVMVFNDIVQYRTCKRVEVDFLQLSIFRESAFHITWMLEFAFKEPKFI